MLSFCLPFDGCASQTPHNTNTNTSHTKTLATRIASLSGKSVACVLSHACKRMCQRDQADSDTTTSTSQAVARARLLLTPPPTFGTLALPR